MYLTIDNKKYHVFLYKYFNYNRYNVICKFCNEEILKRYCKTHLKKHIKNGEVKL